MRTQFSQFEGACNQLARIRTGVGVRVYTSNQSNERSSGRASSSKTTNCPQVGVCSGCIDMNQWINTERLLHPARIGVFGPLIYRERDCADQCYARQWCGYASEKSPPLLCLVCLFATVGETGVLVCLHSSFDRVQWELCAVSGRGGEKDQELLPQRRLKAHCSSTQQLPYDNV